MLCSSQLPILQVPFPTSYIRVCVRSRAFHVFSPPKCNRLSDRKLVPPICIAQVCDCSRRLCKRNASRRTSPRSASHRATHPDLLHFRCRNALTTALPSHNLKQQFLIHTNLGSPVNYQSRCRQHHAFQIVTKTVLTRSTTREGYVTHSWSRHTAHCQTSSRE